jgi:hypothetical protein
MKITRFTVVAALLAGTLAGCIVRPPACRTDCWWSHGQRVCERRCY